MYILLCIFLKTQIFHIASTIIIHFLHKVNTYYFYNDNRKSKNNALAFRKRKVKDMENQEGRYIIEYDTQTGQPIYSDGYRGESRASGDEQQFRTAPEPQPMPEGNVYRFQNVEAVRPKKVKKGWTMPKIALGAVMFGVIAAGCFFGVNAGLNALTGGAGEQTP
jgi:hypothetical protein